MTWSRQPPTRAGGKWRIRRVVAECKCGGLLTDEESEPLDVIRVGERLFVCPPRGTRALRAVDSILGFEWKREAGHEHQ